VVVLRTPTLAGARVPKKPTISFQFFAASPKPPSAFVLNEVARKWLVFSGSLHHYKTVLLYALRLGVFVHCFSVIRERVATFNMVSYGRKVICACPTPSR
jgi:hypothetical protein